MSLTKTDVHKELLNAGCSTVQELTQVLKALPQAEIDIEHVFEDGMYTRYGAIQAGCMIVGRIHRKGSLNFLMKGSISISENGQEPILYTAPAVWVSSVGTQKIGYTVEDIYMSNVYATKCTDVESAEEELLYPEETTLEEIRDDKTRLEP